MYIKLRLQMSQHQKESLVSIISNIAVSIPYFVFVIGKYQAEQPRDTEELVFWATAILLMIPVRIAAQIIIYIAFTIGQAIAKGGELDRESELVDERDKLIELKGDRNGSYLFYLGFAIAMGIMVANQSIATMFLIIIVSGFLSEMVGLLSQIYYYQKGV